MGMGKVKLLITAAIILPSFFSSAEVSDSAFAKCASEEGELSRLSCYDALAEKNGLNGIQVEKSDSVQGAGKWIVKKTQNPIDDTTTVFLFLEADSGKTKFGKPITLISRCQAGKIDVFIDWNEYLGREADVLTRIGKEKARTSQWSLSTDHQATFHPYAIPFLKELKGQESFVAQVTPYNESPITAVFDTSGFDEAIKALKEVCPY